MTSSTDGHLDQLANRASGGDQEAFRNLALAISPPVYRLAWRILADAQLAADVVQEFLIKLMSVLPGYDEEQPFWPWARRIASRQAIDLARREKNWRRVPLEVVPEFAASAAERPDHRLEASQVAERVCEATRFLTGRQRAIFVLRDLEEWTTAEIAEHLDMAESTVRVHLARARTRLRRALSDEHNEGGTAC